MRFVAKLIGSVLLFTSWGNLIAATTQVSSHPASHFTKVVHTKSAAKAKKVTDSTSTTKADKQATTSTPAKPTAKASATAKSSIKHTAQHVTHSAHIAPAVKLAQPTLPVPPAIVLAQPDHVDSTGSRILAAINKSLSNLSYTSYHFGGNYINDLKGIYRVDCSSYVDHLLKQSAPVAYQGIVNWSGSYHPASRDYFAFFRALPADKLWHNWYAVSRVSQLKVGDIIALHYSKHKNAAGHMMVVVAEPTQVQYQDNIYYVRVADSARSGHSEDTRQFHRSGIGAGTLLMKVNPSTQEPYAYAWRVGSPWKYNMSVAMGRPAG